MPDSVTKDSEAEIQYPPSILEDVTKLVQRVQTFTGATGAAIALREGEDMVCRGSRGSNAPDVGMILSLDGTFTGLAVTGMKAVRCDDTENDPRVDPEISRSLRIKSMAVVPVLSGMRVSGVIATFSSAGSAFSDTHMAVLKTMADGLGANIQRWLEGQGLGTSAHNAASAAKPPAPPQAKIEAPRPAPPQPKAEPARPTPPPPPPPAPRVEAPKPAPAPIAPKIETPKVEPAVAKPGVAASAAAAAAPAPAVEKTPEAKPQPKKQEPKQQGKWKPVTPPKQEGEAAPEVKPVAKAEPKAQPKPETKPESKPQPKAEPVVTSAPSFSYETKGDSEGSKTPVIIGGVAAALLVVALGGYFMFGHKSSQPTASATPTTATQPAQAPATTTPTGVESATTANGSKPDAAKPGADKNNDKNKQQQADTSRPTPAPLIVAPTPAANQPQQTAEVAPPSISISGGAGPALDVPVTTSAPKLSAPAPANAVIVPSRLLQRVNPIYPSAAKQYRIEGAVTIDATVGPDGHVRQAKVVSGPAMLRDSAVSAVRQWKYSPSTVNGRAVESSVRIVLQFNNPG